MSGTGVSFSEVMKGRLDVSPIANAGSWVILRVQVSVSDLDAFLEDPLHGGSLKGAIFLSALSCDWLPAKGKVELLAMGCKVGERIMRYRVDFQFNGLPHTLVGDKFVHNDPGFDAWKDVTRLHAKVVRMLPSGDHEQLWAGIMKLSFFEAARLMSTLRGTGDGGRMARLGATIRFAWFFVREIITVFLPRSAS